MRAWTKPGFVGSIKVKFSKVLSVWMPGTYKIRACKPLTVGLFSGLKLMHMRYE